VVTRGGWAVLSGFGICLATIVVPWSPPARQILVLFNKTGAFALAPAMFLIALETVVITTVAVGASLRLARWRS
jgi:hypothetical protein